MIGAELRAEAERWIAGDPDERDRARRRLHNLGYAVSQDVSLEDQPEPVRAFQTDHQVSHGLQPTGTLDPKSDGVLREVHDACVPSPKRPQA